MAVTRIFYHLRNALAVGDSPRCLALGASLGAMIGLVPKGNLTCLGLCVLALLTPANLAVTMATAAALTLVSPLIDPATHWIGVKLLDAAPLQGLWETLAATPLMHWTGFNNTVVAGSLLLGAIAFLPVYWFSRLAFAWGTASRELSEATEAEVASEPARSIVEQRRESAPSGRARCALVRSCDHGGRLGGRHGRADHGGRKCAARRASAPLGRFATATGGSK